MQIDTPTENLAHAPTVGRIVHFVFPREQPTSPAEAPGLPKVRPGIITAVHTRNCVSLVVFLDGPSDASEAMPCLWRGSVLYHREATAGPGNSWHWPPRPSSEAPQVFGIDVASEEAPVVAAPPDPQDEQAPE